MIFETNGYYKHSNNKLMHVCGTAMTHTYGKTLVAEDNEGNLQSVGTTEDSTIGWTRITKEDFFTRMYWKT